MSEAMSRNGHGSSDMDFSWSRSRCAASDGLECGGRWHDCRESRSRAGAAHTGEVRSPTPGPSAFANIPHNEGGHSWPRARVTAKKRRSRRRTPSSRRPQRGRSRCGRRHQLTIRPTRRAALRLRVRAPRGVASRGNRPALLPSSSSARASAILPRLERPSFPP